MLCHGHLGRHRSLALQLRLVLLKRLLPTALEILTVVMLGHAMLERGGCVEAGQLRQLSTSRKGVRTVPQNSRKQCGHLPTIRRTAWLQGVSDWSWQRFLAGMAITASRSVEVVWGVRCLTGRAGQQGGSVAG